MEKTNLKKGNVREFTFRNGKTAVGIVVETENEEDKAVLFLPALAAGDREFLYNSGIMTERTDPFPGEGSVAIKDIKEAKIKRGLPEGFRESLTAGMNKCIQFRKGRLLLEKVRQSQQLLSKEGGEIVRKAWQEAGLLSEEEFHEKILSSLPPETKNSLSGYSFTEPCEVMLSMDSSIYLTKTLDTWLTARDMSFCYTEYDGNIFFRDGAENDPTYRKILKKYHEEKPGIGIKQKESLFSTSGYNGRIFYQSYFEIPKPEQLTEKTLQETVNLIQAKKTVRKKQR